MKFYTKYLASILLCLFSISHLFSQAIKDIDNLVSITFYEKTGSTSTFTYDIDGSELNTKLSGQLNSSNNDFQGWVGNEFFDVYYSNGDGAFNTEGMFISIDVRFDNSSGGGGGNIMEVEFNFANGSSIFASHLESFNANGTNYILQSELSAVDCDLNTWSTLGNTNGITENLRLTLGIKNTYTEINYVGCLNDGYSIEVNGIIYNEDNISGTEILTASGGCDSLISINLEFPYSNVTTEVNYVGCQNDGYSIEVNGTTYDEDNTTGTEILMTSNGCDSIIDILLSYEISSIENLSNTECLPVDFFIEINGNIYDIDNPSGVESMTNVFGCDSIINIDYIFENFIITNEINYVGCQDDGCFVEVNNTIYDEDNSTGNELLVGNGGCDSMVIINLDFLNCDATDPFCDIFIPNAFSPNVDGYNDYFSVYASEKCQIEAFNIRVYNRWGAEVFQSNDLDFKWDGSFKNKDLKIGVFVWYLEYINTESNEQIRLKGNVTIMK
ncbi:MAG: gliding motility-associated C-terminal domain-containing protein [Saprospiraceae bacterium]